MRQPLFTEFQRSDEQKKRNSPFLAGTAAARFMLCLIGASQTCGCAALQLATSKSRLQVQSVMATPIFPEPPASAADNSFYLDVRNGTDKPGLDAMDAAVRDILTKRGYREASRPQEAHYVLQAAILLSGREALTASEKEKKLASRDQLTSIGAAGLAGAEDATGGAPLAGGVALAILGGTLATAVDASVQDVTYTFKTEIQLTEPTDSIADEQTKQTLKQGETGTTTIAFGEPRGRKRARTSITTTANRANLTWEEAETAVLESLAHALAGALPAPVKGPDGASRIDSAPPSLSPQAADHTAPDSNDNAPLPPLAPDVGKADAKPNVTPGPRPQDPTAGDLMGDLIGRANNTAPQAAAPVRLHVSPASVKRAIAHARHRKHGRKRKTPPAAKAAGHDTTPTESPASACGFAGSLPPSLSPPRPAACFPGDAPERPRKKSSGRRRRTVQGLDHAHKTR